MPYRGTTPKFTLTVNGLSQFNLQQVWVTMKSAETETQITKTISDITITGNTIVIHLTQADTLAFGNENISVQVRILTTSQESYATNTQSFYMQQILKDGQIS